MVTHTPGEGGEEPLVRVEFSPGDRFGSPDDWEVIAPWGMVSCWTQKSYAEENADFINTAAESWARERMMKFAENIIEAYSDGEMHYPSGRFAKYVRKLAQEA